MSELASAITALIVGAMLGLLMGALLSNSTTRDWIIDGGFELNGIAYKVERLNQ